MVDAAAHARAADIVQELRRHSEQDRVHALADQFGIHPRQVNIQLGYAADQPEEIEARIAANEAAMVEAQRAHGARQRLLDSA